MLPKRYGDLARLLPLAFAMAVLGCHKDAPPPSANGPETNSFSLTQVRATYAKVDPNAIVGIVAAVDSTNRLAAISDVDPRMFRLGQSVTFVDAENHALANGQVLNLTNYVDVKYEKPGVNQRAPKVGDLAVRFGSSR